MRVQDAEFLELVIQELTQHHGCHTVVLYGSRARGDATGESDWDVAGVRPERDGIFDVVRDARLFHGAYLDAFVYTESALSKLDDEELLKFVGGRVVLERDSTGSELLERARAVEARGPAPLRDDQERMERTWVEKTLARAGRGDTEGNFRRVWLLVDLLPLYFRLRGRWYRGPKESLVWLALHDPVTSRAFERALSPGAPLVEFEMLAARVLAR
jgi:predicted nucleotidyltransferase